MCIELDSRLRGNDTGKIMTISKYNNIHPQIAKDVFVAEGAQIIGDVEIASGSSVWFNTVIRGDVNYIRIGERVNVQDLSVIHVESGGHPTLIGDDVTIGHRAIVHACTIGNRCLIGMGAVGFGAVHIQYPLLVVATGLMGAVYVYLFQRWRNLWPLALCHGWLGSFFYPWVLDENPTASMIRLILQ